MRPEQITNRRRVVEISYEAGASHLGSALSAVDIIEAIYSVKKPDEKFVLSNGHAASALYAVMERYGLLHDPHIEELGVHPNRNLDLGIEISTGSLGQGLPIAVGMALADRSKNIYCCVSDGECAEGSIWEALRIAHEQKLNNLKMVVNANGYGGYSEVDINRLITSIQSFGWIVVEIDGHDLECLASALRLVTTKPTVIIAHTNVNQLPFLTGLSAHYHSMSAEDYELALGKWSSN